MLLCVNIDNKKSLLTLKNIKKWPFWGHIYPKLFKNTLFLIKSSIQTNKSKNSSISLNIHRIGTKNR